MNIFKRALIALGLLFITSPAIAGEYDVVYKTTEQGELKMMIYTPDNVKKNAKLPTVIFFHGGGWSSGWRSFFFGHADYFRQRGMVGVSVQYRLANDKTGLTPAECLMDAKSAIRFVKENAKQFNVDPKRVVLGGGSAGAHLATASQLCEGYDDPNDNLKTSTEACALLLLNPVLCNGAETEGAYKGWGHKRVAGFWESFSPMHNVKKGVPPTLYMLGDRDRLIPKEQAPEYQRLVEEVGGRCDVIIYEGCDHGFFNINNKTKSAKYYRQTLIDMDNFLVSLGLLKGEEFVTEWLDAQDKGYTY